MNKIKLRMGLTQAQQMRMRALSTVRHLWFTVLVADVSFRKPTTAYIDGSNVHTITYTVSVKCYLSGGK